MVDAWEISADVMQPHTAGSCSKLLAVFGNKWSCYVGTVPSLWDACFVACYVEMNLFIDALYTCMLSGRPKM